MGARSACPARARRGLACLPACLLPTPHDSAFTPAPPAPPPPPGAPPSHPASHPAPHPSPLRRPGTALSAPVGWARRLLPQRPPLLRPLPPAARPPGGWPACWLAPSTGAHVCRHSGAGCLPACVCVRGSITVAGWLAAFWLVLPVRAWAQAHCSPSLPSPPPTHTHTPREWTPDQRWELLRLLCLRCTESSGVHDTLMGEEEEVRAQAAWGREGSCCAVLPACLPASLPAMRPHVCHGPRCGRSRSGARRCRCCATTRRGCKQSWCRWRAGVALQAMTSRRGVLAQCAGATQPLSWRV